MNLVTSSVQEQSPAAEQLYATTVLPSVEPMSRLGPMERSDQIDQAYDEYCRLCESGTGVDPDEYCTRFPAFQTSLRRLLEAHRQMIEHPELFEGLGSRWPELGGVFLGFQLLQELGRGAFARVFLAREQAVGKRLVALKVSLHDDHEADTLGKLQHPNVVTIYSAQTDPGTGFTAVCMPFLGSVTLCDVIDCLATKPTRTGRADVLLHLARDKRWQGAGAAPPARSLQRGSYLDGTLYLGERMAEALAYVHAQSILHRDLKPSNVLICPNGEPVLLDFNLAMNQQYAEHRLGGTLPYMPPEQLEAMAQHRRGEAVPGDARADFYALGVILYELLTGAHPFGPVPLKFKTQEAREFLLQRQQRGPQPLRKFNADVDPALEALVARCLSRDPAERPASARDLAAALRRFRSPLRRTVRWLAVHPRTVAAAAMLGVATAGASGAMLASMPPAAVRYERSGEEHFLSGRFTEAIRSFNQSLDENPNQPDVYFKRARALQQLGPGEGESYEKALEDYKRANPDGNGRILACMGFCQAQLRRPKPAADCYRQAIKAGFATAEVHNNLAFCYSRLGMYLEAEDSASDALAIDAGLVNAHFIRAQARCNRANKLDYDPAPALDDMRIVIATTGGTDHECFMAATICAKSLRFRKNPPNDPLNTLVKQYTRWAAERGMGTRVNNDPVLSRWATEGPQVNAQFPTPTLGLLDPLRGLIQ